MAKGYRVPRQFGRFDTVDVQSSNFETFQEQATLATDIIDARAFGGLDEVNIGPTIEQVISSAIQYAAAVGAHFVAIPTSMAGFNAALVTTNPNVTLVFEGSAGLLSSTYVASAFIGATKEARIQAAINAAASTGAKAVYVPANMQPYDASQVTFNNAIHMLREGGYLTLDEWDVRAYGAAGDNITDDTIRCQSAIDAASNADAIVGPRTVRFPVGRYMLSSPLRVYSHGTHLVGSKQAYTTATKTAAVAGSVLDTLPGFFGGPVILVATSDGPTNLVAPLVGNLGNSFKDEPAGGAGTTARLWWPFCDTGVADVLNGGSAMSVRCFFKTTMGAITSIIVSIAGINTGTPATSTSTLYFGTSNGHAIVFVTVNGVLKSAQDPATTATDGNVHHLEASYDGSNLRLFVDGTLVATTAAAGTITKPSTAALNIGAIGGDIDGDNSGNPGLNGTCYSVQLSNIVYHTASFTTPTAAHTVDINTLFLANFDQQKGRLSRFSFFDTNTNLWIPQHSTIPAAVGLAVWDFRMDGIKIHPVGGKHLAVQLLGDNQAWEISNADFRNVYSGVSVGAANGNGFQWKMSRMYVAAGSFSNSGYAFRIGANAGIGDAQTIEIHNIPFGLYLLSGSMTFSDVWLTTGNQTVLPIYNKPVQGTANIFNNFILDTESRPTDAIYIASLVAWAGMTFTSGLFEALSATYTGAHILFAQNAVGPVQFIGTGFTAGAAQTVLAKKLASVGSITNPVLQMMGAYQTLAWIPWSDTPGSIVIAPLGKGGALAFAATVSLDCSLRDEFEIATLTGAITLNFTNATPGQRISVWTLQDGAGAHGVTFGTVNGAGAVKGASAADTAAGHFDQWIFEANLNGNMTQIGFSSGA